MCYWVHNATRRFFLESNHYDNCTKGTKFYNHTKQGNAGEFISLLLLLLLYLPPPPLAPLLNFNPSLCAIELHYFPPTLRISIGTY